MSKRDILKIGLIKRLRGISIRQNLTDEWKERGVNDRRGFAILTAEISKATFGITPSEYRKYKKLPRKSRTNLRDHMTDLELIFTMLGEKVTTEISQKEQPENMDGNKKVARRGGNVAGNARKETEKELGRSVVSKENFLIKGDEAFEETNKVLSIPGAKNSILAGLGQAKKGKGADISKLS